MMAEIPDLSRGRVLGGKTWHCQLGHEWRGSVPPGWAFQLPQGPPIKGEQQMQIIQRSGICLICLVEWAHNAFPLFDQMQATNGHVSEKP